MKANEFIKQVIVPVVSALFLAAMFYPLCMENRECSYLKLWFLMGIPFGIHRMLVWVIPKGHDIGSSMGIVFINVLAGGIIGGIVIAWRLAVAAVYLVRIVITMMIRTIRKLAGEPFKALRGQ